PVVQAPAAPAPAPEPAAEPEQTLAQARAAEAALSREDRQAIQQALQWFGHYGAAIDGAFGPGTRAAIAAWQTAAQVDPTGVLTTRQTAALLDAARREQAALDLGPVTESEAGIEIALPRALVQFDRYDPPFALFGERVGSGFTVMLISQPGDRAALAGLYDILQSLQIMPLEGAREIGARSFTLSGRNGAIQTRAYAETSGGLIKGWLVSAPLAQAEAFDRVAAAMADSFRAVGNRALDPGLAPLPEATRAALLPGLDVRRPARSRSGFYVDGRGQVLTAAEAVEGCARLTLDGGVEATVAFADPALGIALLTPLAPLAPLRVAGLDATGARPGLDVAAAGYPYEDALPAPTLTFGRLEATQGLNGEADLLRLTLPALPGDSGAALIGPTGAVLGLVLPAPADGIRALPPGVTFARSATALSARLAAAGVTPRPAEAQGALAPEDITRIGTEIGVLVSCWN
ncbi:MAG: peptidoglycan-binding protein, partial [Rhodobacterales bacterium]|nr:peptidoglycan-binding protein [Rhodobacterales bacterium]